MSKAHPYEVVYDPEENKFILNLTVHMGNDNGMSSYLTIKLFDGVGFRTHKEEFDRLSKKANERTTGKIKRRRPDRRKYNRSGRISFKADDDKDAVWGMIEFLFEDSKDLKII